MLLPLTAMAADWGAVSIDSSKTWLEVTFENSVYKAVIRENAGGTCGHEHAIRDWITKSDNIDQVGNYIDACAQRGPLKKATVLCDTADSIKFRMEFRNCTDTLISAISEYTVYPGSPVIKIDYVKYTNWANTVDIGTPGGTNVRSSLETKIFGQDSYSRNLQYHPGSYWNTYDGGDYKNDPVDGGSLNYNGYMIMAVGNTITGAGYGRIMPVIAYKVGGIKIVKLLWNQGFETFPATGQTVRLPFTGYLYVFDSGLDSAIEMGKMIADGNYFINQSTHIDKKDNSSIPGTYNLYQNYPNPCNPETTIQYDLEVQSHVILNIYTVTGQKIETLVNTFQAAGNYSIIWRPEDLPSGIYFYRLNAGAFSETKKILLMK